MTSMLRQVWTILSSEERRRFLVLQPLVVLSALLETAGLASVAPLLTMLGDPGVIHTNPHLSQIYGVVGFESPTSFLLAVGGGVLVLVTVGNGFSAWITWLLMRFAWMGNHTLSLRLLEHYLGRDYSFHLAHGGAQLANNVLSEVSQVVSGVIVAIIQMVARSVVLVGVVITLLLVDPMMAVGTAGVFGSMYVLMFVGIRRRVKHDGIVRQQSNHRRHKLALEAFGGIKELKLYGLEGLAAEAYGTPSREYGAAQARMAVVGQIPRLALESIAFGGLLVLVLGMLWRGQKVADVLPVLGLYAFSAYRMLPGLQAIFSGISSLRFSASSLELIATELSQPVPRASRRQPEGRTFNVSLELRDVSFLYRDAARPALRQVSVELARGEWVAVVGPTGAGKSTFVDMLLGLLKPEQGEIILDGVPVSDETRDAWRATVSYVPQQIFLVDDTIERNICFGIDPHLVDRERMREAARVAQIADFIQGELPLGYETEVGERGVRLSGGQRQRLGIARALYRRPGLLVLDEATSALDNVTEADFFLALREDLSHVTVVSIAHRLSTIRSFDRAILMVNGAIAAVGSPGAAMAGEGAFSVLRTEGADP